MVGEGEGEVQTTNMGITENVVTVGLSIESQGKKF